MLICAYLFKPIIEQCVQRNEMFFKIWRTNLTRGGGIAAVVIGLAGKQDGDNQSVQGKGFTEDQNQHHGNVKPGLLSSSTDTTVTNNTNGHTYVSVNGLNSQKTEYRQPFQPNLQ